MLVRRTDAEKSAILRKFECCSDTAECIGNRCFVMLKEELCTEVESEKGSTLKIFS